MLTAYCGLASVPTTSNKYKKCPKLSNHQATKHNPRLFRTICKAKGDDKKGKGAPKGPGDGKDAARKADFSAYWSLQVRQWFSSRKGYLDGAEATPVDPDKPPEWLAKLEEAAKEARAEMDAAIEAEHAERMEHAATSEGSSKVLSMLEKAMSKPGAPPMRKMSPMEQVEMNAQMARAYLHTTQVSGLVLTLYRLQRVVRDLFLLPFKLAASAWQGWKDLFASQRYENFLMSEGERIWGWRNRTENERWFWEIFALDRLVFPLLSAIAYQNLVPDHLVWVAVVPSMFIMWQTGKLPGPLNMEFWAIAYFGVYKKCWGDVMAIARALFVWA